jgi:hypothetical protein
MRTTLDIEDDVLAAAKELARMQHVSAGRVVSRLMREALSGYQTSDPVARPGTVNVAGFRPFPPRGAVVTNDIINDLRDREGV